MGEYRAQIVGFGTRDDAPAHGQLPRLERCGSAPGDAVAWVGACDRMDHLAYGAVDGMSGKDGHDPHAILGALQAEAIEGLAQRGVRGTHIPGGIVYASVERFPEPLYDILVGFDRGGVRSRELEGSGRRASGLRSDLMSA
ncbi:MAG: hypothetical protein ACXVBY_22915 [Isosphaeraceae bacterium]